MRRIGVLLLPLLFVAMGVVHAAHAHDADPASNLHPVCTLCQFHAPAATCGETLAHSIEPQTSARVLGQAPASSPRSAHDNIHASRAPPALLAS
jgi:hypothetical protein